MTPLNASRMEVSERRPLMRGAGAEEGFDARDVGGNVDFDAFVGAFGDADTIAIFHPAQLLELLEAFEFAGRERGEFEKRVAAKNVKADVFEMARGDGCSGVADPGNGRAGKIERVAVEIADDLDDIGIHDFVGRGDGDAERGDLRFGAGIFGGENGVHASVDDFRRNEREIALNVDVNVGGDVHGDFGDAFGAGAMLAARHDGFAAESFDRRFDALVVRGDDDARDEAALARALNDVLNHGAAGDGREGLAGKTRRSIARGDDGEDSRIGVFGHAILYSVASRS